MVEKEVGASIKCLDRGREFNSIEFDQFCRKNGIKRQLITSYTPQQNGVAERKNRMVTNLVRAMFTGKQVPKTFWPEAVKWAMYVLNRSPMVAVKDMNPEEAWSGRKPSVEHFHVFGCVAHVHVPDAKRTKLEDKNLRYVLLGVSSESKGYRLYDPIAERIVVSRDVTFEEGKQQEWESDSKRNQLDDLEWDDREESKQGEEIDQAHAKTEYGIELE